jgi:predicted PurR-regulated permease PerM
MAGSTVSELSACLYCLLQLALVILMVTGIHFIEAYGLNPAIYSAHLKLHPLLVLTVLVVAEHSLGVWGLLLAGARSMPSCA